LLDQDGSTVPIREDTFCSLPFTSRDKAFIAQGDPLSRACRQRTGSCETSPDEL